MADKYRKGRYLNQLKKCLSVAERRGEPITGPVYLRHVLCFLLDEIFVRGNATSGLSDVLSQLKMAVTASVAYTWDLSEAELLTVKSFIVVLKKDKPHTVKRATPVRKNVMSSMLNYLSPQAIAGNKWATMYCSILTLLHQTMARLKEVTEGNLAWRHITPYWDNDKLLGYKVHLERRKTQKTKIDADTGSTYIWRRLDEFDAVSWLEKWASESSVDIRHPSDNPEALLDLPVYYHMPITGNVARHGTGGDLYLSKDRFVTAWRREILSPCWRG